MTAGTATFALVPGAGSAPWYWHLVEAELTRRGHEAVAVDLPCEDESAGLADYAEAVVRAVADRRPLVLVGQSFGCYSALLACERLTADLLVLLTPMIPAPGESADEWWVASGQAEARQGQIAAHGSDPIATFLHDVPSALATEALARSRDQAAAPLAEPWPLRRLPEVPTRVLLGRDDRFFPPAFVRRSATERIGLIPDEIDGGHAVALSRPVELAERLQGYWETVAGHA